jgi:[ribosomal protein S18]-alanine N-acetyltransferase
VDPRVARHLKETAPVAIRPARLGDVDALLALETAAFESDRLERRSFRHAVRSPTISLLVAETAKGIAGYAMVLRRRGSATAHLGSIAVAPAASRIGVGKSLLAACEFEAASHDGARLRLEVREDNNAAQELYETMGYERVERIDDYYEDGTAAWRYVKTLPGRAGRRTPPLRKKAPRERNGRRRAKQR